ncbi:60S ribosomal protein L27, partial [Musa troglodytarum]
ARPKVAGSVHWTRFNHGLTPIALAIRRRSLGFPLQEAARGKEDKMVKFLKPNKAVIILQGRFAGRKAVIVRAFDDGTRERPYGHCLVAGVAKYPKKVIRKDSAKKTAKKSRVKAFLKLVNYSHIMPTRYTLDVDLKDVVTVDALQSRDKKVTVCKETKARLEERFKTGKNRWFFTKLRF